MAANSITGLNQVFPIYNQDGTPFNDMVLYKASVDSVVMSLGDKITGDAYYRDNALNVTMQEYIIYNGVKYVLVNPPTIVREGLVQNNSELKGMTKYSFEFYHPMYQLSNLPFADIAISSSEERYLSENKTFSWIGKPQDLIDKINKNLEGTQWIVVKSSVFPQDKENELSGVIPFDKNMVSDALKAFYDTWGVPYIIDVVSSSEASYAQGKRFKVICGYPSNEIYADEIDRQSSIPYVFRMGQGVGLKNNSRTPRNNKIITRISGYGSEDNIPYGYPQIVWTGAEDDQRLRYPLYDGIVGGRNVKLIQHPFTRKHLMPSVYTDAVNKKVNPDATGYNPNIELKDYYDAIGSEYVNQINPLAPSYEIHEFEYIKPEMNDGSSNVEILGAVPLNDDLTPASEWIDDIDGDGNFVQSYFRITLPQFTFDLYACAAITQEMHINMRSGDCIGCTFPVQVDWDDYKLNFYDENGDFAPDGEQRDLTKYPKSNLGSISVVVQKENSTFGTIMPSRYQHPQSGDEFVILGISFPAEYITNAEQRLDAEMRAFMLENNIYYYDYPLKFDEHFLATHTYILSQLRPNSIVRFDFAGSELQLYVKQITIKYGNSILPEYDITLTDNIEVVLNQIGQAVDEINKLGALLSVLRQSYSGNMWIELAKKLSKVSDDTAQGFIRFIKGLQVGNQFVTGLLGEGGVFRKEADGTTYLEADKMYIRIKAYFDNVEIRDFKHSAGNRIASPAGAKCCRVEYIDANGSVTTNVANAVKFRCYFKGSDGDDEVRNNFVVGDQAYCHITSVDTKDDDPNSKSLNMKHYWRLVVGRNATDVLTENGEHWIDLSNRASETLTIDGETYTHAGYQSSSDVPAAQDDIIQLGNINDTDRMGAIIEFVTGADAPSYQIFQGINNFNLNGKNYIGLGYSTQTGRAYINIYGDAYIGDKPDAQGNASSYLKYNAGNRQLSIKAKIDATSTIDGATIDEYIEQHSSDWSEEEINALIHDVTDDIQAQIDGAIDTWFYNGTPSDSVLPESEWKAIDTAAGNNNERLKHLGDIYYDNTTGYAYRYSNTGTESSPVFVWNPVADSAVVEALRRAAQAQDTADGKRTIYSVWNAWMKGSPSTNTLEIGDLFVPQSDTTQGSVTYKANKVYKCTTKGSATFQEVAYTDDSAFNFWVANSYAQTLAGLNDNIGGAYTAAGNAQSTANDAKTAAGNAQAAANALTPIKNALNGATLVDGGLLLTSLIGLRQYNGSGDKGDINNYTTWGGINGTYVNGNTIAAWFGGGMVDHEKNPTASNYAKILFRMNGSGYMAGGKFSWDDSGGATIGGFEIGANGGSTLGTTDWNNGWAFIDRSGFFSVNKLNSARTYSAEIYGGAAIYAGVGVAGTDNDNYIKVSSNGVYIHGNVYINTGSTLKAYYHSDELGTGGGGGSTSSAWTDITGKPTTISGYGITDCKISNGTITIGSSSIKPITSHQSLSGYATETWVNNKGYLTSSSLNGYATTTWVDNNYLSRGGGTVKGHLHLKFDNSNYGCYLIFGDRPSSGQQDYAYLGENSDDHMVLYGKRGVLVQAGGTGGSNGRLILESLVQSTLDTAYTGIDINCVDGILNIKSDGNNQGCVEIGTSHGTSIYTRNETAVIVANDWSSNGSSYSHTVGNISILTKGTNGNITIKPASGNTEVYNFVNRSDIRNKDILEYKEYSVELFARSPLFGFTWKDSVDKREHIGTSAQYWQPLIPETVSTIKDYDKDGRTIIGEHLSLDYITLSFIGVVSLAREVMRLQEEVNKLKQSINN